MEENTKEKVVNSYSNDDENLEKEEPIKTEEEKGEEKKTQTREENSKFADIRRTKKENEKLKERISVLEQSLRDLKQNSIDKETLEDLGLDNVDSEENYRIASKYQNYKKDGSVNPKEKTYEELYKEAKQKEQEQEQIKNAEIKRKELIEEDANNLKKTYNITPKEAFNDKNFMDAYGHLINYGNLTELYGSYLSIKKTFEKDIRDKQKEKGSLPTNASGVKTTKSYIEMSKEEKVKYLKSKYKI